MTAVLCAFVDGEVVQSYATFEENEIPEGFAKVVKGKVEGTSIDAPGPKKEEANEKTDTLL